MSKKKMIRVSEYARITGQAVETVNKQIRAEKLKSELVGGVRHVAYPDKELIKYQQI